MPKYSNAEMPEYRHTGISEYRHVGMSALPSVVFGFALLQYFQSLPDGRITLSVQECMYGTNSPGQVFKLDENSLMEYVEELESSTGGMIVLDETAGLKQVYRRALVDPVSLLERHYHPEADHDRICFSKP